MTKPGRLSTKTPLLPVPSRQMSIGFESIRLIGLSAPERTKALTHLARLLMLAAAVTSYVSGNALERSSAYLLKAVHSGNVSQVQMTNRLT